MCTGLLGYINKWVFAMKLKSNDYDKDTIVRVKWLAKNKTHQKKPHQYQSELNMFV